MLEDNEIEFIDEETGERYIFDFSNTSNWFYVRRYFANSNSYGEGVPIINGQPGWEPYHLKQHRPLISPAARQFAERILKLKAFL